jgi:hypothetical protein
MTARFLAEFRNWVPSASCPGCSNAAGAYRQRLLTPATFPWTDRIAQ